MWKEAAVACLRHYPTETSACLQTEVNSGLNVDVTLIGELVSDICSTHSARVRGLESRLC
jgi:hypothetical protein